MISDLFGIAEEKNFLYKGYKCVVLFNSLGFRCGYVGLPKDSIFYGVPIDEIPVYCHGGISYAKHCLTGRNDEDVYWIGFGCAEHCDGFDLVKAEEYFRDSVKITSLSRYQEDKNKLFEPRSLEFVIGNLKSIVDQIIKKENELNPAENNQVTIGGKVISEFRYSHEVESEKFYMVDVEVNRLSGVVDKIPCMVSGRMADVGNDYTGGKIYISGQFRSYNQHRDGKSKLVLYVFVRSLEFLDETSEICTNNIVLNGYLCKKPVYRVTPNGREIADVLVAINRAYCKSDYIPCIVWGRNARYISNFGVGTNIELKGRIQSREYCKVLDGGKPETRTAYEVSASTINVLDEV